MQLHYLEIVTAEVDAVCAAYGDGLGLHFSAPDPALGDARTARLADGSRVGVRAPMHESEAAVVRPYWRVDDLEAALAAAEQQGAATIHPPLELPGKGRFAIYLQGGIEHGLWQLDDDA